MRIETERLVITELNIGMAEAFYINSQDEDTRRFLPDEVYESEQQAAEVIERLIGCYSSPQGPFVYAVSLKTGENIGLVEAVALKEGGWEVGYHIGRAYTGRGYAAEAVKAFLPVIMARLGTDSIWGVCLAENKASVKVLERCGFVRAFAGLGRYQGAEREIVKYVFTKQ